MEPSDVASPNALDDLVGQRWDRSSYELSWLDFVDRLLFEAEDCRSDPFDRATALAMVDQSLDELFCLQIPALRRPDPDVVSSRHTSQGPLDVIRSHVVSLVGRQRRALLDEILPALARASVVLCDWRSLDGRDRCQLDEMFYDWISLSLSPVDLDLAGMFPITGLAVNLVVIVRDPASGRGRLSRVELPERLPRFIASPDSRCQCLLEQVVSAHLDELFPQWIVESSYSFRVTRDASTTFNVRDEDGLLALAELQLRQKQRVGCPVRLEVEPAMPAPTRTLLERWLGLTPSDTYVVDGPLGLGRLRDLWDRPSTRVISAARSSIKSRPLAWPPMAHLRLAASLCDHDPFSVMREGEVLVHHPYDQPAPVSVEALVDQAAEDPEVLAIKETFHCVSTDSPIVKSLVRAAENAKQVVVVIEVRARSHQQTNIACARTLAQAGAHVIYGMVGLETHAQVVLVLRNEEGKIRQYCHMATGGHHSTSGPVYEDLGLFSTDAALGNDICALFNYLTGYSRMAPCHRMLVAPASLRSRLLDLIWGEQEVQESFGGCGQVAWKVNHLMDDEIIDALYQASRAGVQVDMVVRGVCRLLPGPPGNAENIRVRSMVSTRPIEHSRIFAFGVGDRRRYYIGSADPVSDNLDRRVEVLASVVEPGHQDRLQEVLEVYLADDAPVWALGSDGRWRRHTTVGEMDVDERLSRLAEEWERNKWQPRPCALWGLEGRRR